MYNLNMIENLKIKEIKKKLMKFLNNLKIILEIFFDNY